MKQEFFIPGKLSVILDASAGSSGKGKIGSYVTMVNKGKYHFVCNAFTSQASHWVYDKDYPELCYKQFNSNAHRHEEFEKMYIGHGAVIDLKALAKEIEMTGIPRNKIGISPLTGIVQDNDRLYEEGKVDLAGNEAMHMGTISNGSTCSGVGVTRARRVLRDKNILLAKDVPELADLICDVPGEILDRLNKGQSGLLEICQGFQLSNGYKFYPAVTSRNITIAAGLDDMFLPVTVLGNVMLNLRTFPIRIASKKYIAGGKVIFQLDKSVEDIQDEITPNSVAYVDNLLKTAGFENHGYDISCVQVFNPGKVTEGEMTSRKAVVTAEVNNKGKHLTYAEVQSGIFGYEEVSSYSGDGYEDQHEITWEEVEAGYGQVIPDDIKLTSLTKLMRRVFTFSQQNLKDAIIYNQTPHTVFLSLNFVNWIDGKMEGATKWADITAPVVEWIDKNIHPAVRYLHDEYGFENVRLGYLGTSRYTEDTIDLTGLEADADGYIRNGAFAPVEESAIKSEHRTA